MALRIIGDLRNPQGRVRILNPDAQFIDWSDVSDITVAIDTTVHPSPAVEAASSNGTLVETSTISSDGTEFISVYRTFDGANVDTMGYYSVASDGTLTLIDSYTVTDSISGEGCFVQGKDFYVLPLLSGHYRVFDLRTGGLQTSVLNTASGFSTDDALFGHPTQPIFMRVSESNSATIHSGRYETISFNATTLVHEARESDSFSDGINTSVVNSNATRTHILEMSEDFTKIVTAMKFETVSGDPDYRIKVYDVDVSQLGVSSVVTNEVTLISNTSSGTPETGLAIEAQNIPGSGKYILHYTVATDGNNTVTANWRVYNWSDNVLTSSDTQSLTGLASPTQANYETIVTDSFLPSAYNLSRPQPPMKVFADRIMHTYYDSTLGLTFIYSGALTNSEIDFTNWPTGFSVGTMSTPNNFSFTSELYATDNGSLFIVARDGTTDNAIQYIYTK